MTEESGEVKEAEGRLCVKVQTEILMTSRSHPSGAEGFGEQAWKD